MPQDLTPNTRKLMWALMIDADLAATAKKEGVEAAAKASKIELTSGELAAFEKIDLDDLGDLLSAIERDLSIVMGGSRPRRAIALTDGAIKELRDALDLRGTRDAF